LRKTKEGYTGHVRIADVITSRSILDNGNDKFFTSGKIHLIDTDSLGVHLYRFENLCIDIKDIHADTDRYDYLRIMRDFINNGTVFTFDYKFQNCEEIQIGKTKLTSDIATVTFRIPVREA
jgi:hypothetical protein